MNTLFQIWKDQWKQILDESSALDKRTLQSLLGNVSRMKYSLAILEHLQNAHKAKTKTKQKKNQNKIKQNKTKQKNAKMRNPGREYKREMAE